MPEVAQTFFHCDTCQKVAAKVAVVPPYAPDPRFAPEDLGPDGVGTIGEKNARISIEGGPVTVTISLGKELQGEVRNALEAKDALALYEVDFEFAPFVCPKCSAVYCEEHWIVEDVYDEGFYDCAYGTCPRGHRRVLAD